MSAPVTVPVVYQTPEARASKRARLMLAISAGITLLAGLLEIVSTLPQDRPIEWRHLAILVVTLLLTTAVETLRKYAAALDDDAARPPAQDPPAPPAPPAPGA